MASAVVTQGYGTKMPLAPTATGAFEELGVFQRMGSVGNSVPFLGEPFAWCGRLGYGTEVSLFFLLPFPEVDCRGAKSDGSGGNFGRCVL